MKLTLDMPVFLSFARYILDTVPNGLKRSCKSGSLVSSARFDTRIVGFSSVIMKRVKCSEVFKSRFNLHVYQATCVSHVKSFY